MKVTEYFEKAREAALAKRNDFRNFYVGAVGIRSDGAVVSATNGPAVLNEKEKSKGRKHSFPQAHAEYRLCRKLDVGAIVFVYRVKRGSKKVGKARPCEDCQRVLRAVGVSKVYYTINEFEYGVMYLNKKPSFGLVESEKTF